MVKGVSRRAFVAGTAVAGLALLAGCSGSNGGVASSGSAASAGSASSDQSGSANGGSPSEPSSSTSVLSGSTPHIAVGTLATEDILPFWVARDEGLFADEGLDVDIVQFQSATELIAGVGSGEVDLAMTDIMVAASMFASGVNLDMEWVTLGETAEQGRFGIMVGPDSSVSELSELAGVPIGVGTNTILEYVMDRLLESVGVPDDQIVVEELQKLPVRYQAMLSGEVDAAALPGSLLALGEANGCRTIADDTQGDNISQSVMIARIDLHDEMDGDQAIASLKKVWNKAVSEINVDPEAYRNVLVDNASLSAEVAETYPVSSYPTCALPTSKMVEPVLSWMEEKGYLSQKLEYDESTGRFIRV